MEVKHMAERFVNTKELCETLQISRRTVEQSRKLHGLPYYKTGGGTPRYLLTEVKDWMKNNAKCKV